MSRKIIGIDLGAANTCVSVMGQGRPQVIPMNEGWQTTPSVVAFDGSGNPLVGAAAKRLAIQNPEGTIQSIKRQLGTNYRVRIGDWRFSPEQITALILQNAKLKAQQFFRERINRAVITVPANFDDSQRLATKQAAEIAGLEVLRLINAPSAAALAHFYENGGPATRLAVLDFGAGSFDLTIFHWTGGILQAVSTGGSSRLGGDDFDQRIIDWLTRQIRSRYGFNGIMDGLTLQRLKEAAETAKIELSTLQSSLIRLRFLGMADGEPIHLETRLIRPEFERFSENLLESAASPISTALRDARLTPAEIDQIILVGPTTQIPSVKKFIRHIFSNAALASFLPKTAIAAGAAIQGGILSGEIDDMRLADLIPHSLGIEVAGGRVLKIIERNTIIPVSRSVRIPVPAGRISADVHVLQGESDRVGENTSLAHLDACYTTLPEKLASAAEITFDIDANGMFQCRSAAAAAAQRLNSRITVTRTTGYNQKEAQNLKMVEADLKKLKFDNGTTGTTGKLRH
jgi:molecular chaperone DnaK